MCQRPSTSLGTNGSGRTGKPRISAFLIPAPVIACARHISGGPYMNRKTALSLSLLASLAAAGAGYAAGAASAPQTGRVPEFENPQAKVWKSLIVPNTPLPFHRHEHPRALIALQGGTMKILEEDGTSEIHEWKAGHARLLAPRQCARHAASGRQCRRQADRGDRGRTVEGELRRQASRWGGALVCSRNPAKKSAFHLKKADFAAFFLILIQNKFS